MPTCILRILGARSSQRCEMPASHGAFCEEGHPDDTVHLLGYSRSGDNRHVTFQSTPLFTIALLITTEYSDSFVHELHLPSIR